MTRSIQKNTDARTFGVDCVTPILLWVGLAGRLEPLEQFLAQVPANTGLAFFVVVQHLEPDRSSLLVDLLARQVALPVHEALDGTLPERDHVYVIAPGTVLTIERGRFKLARVAERTNHGAVDICFCALAVEHGEHAVGILFSGAGHDGTVGMRAIKERGGLTLAQAPASAKHDTMPLSAIEAGQVDHVLSPEQLAAKLLEHARYMSIVEELGRQSREPDIAKKLGRICDHIVIQEHAQLDKPEELEVHAGTDRQPLVEHLETELRATRVEPKTTVEDLESFNEELKSSNEELISTNEELQSANEELETVNTELRQKVAELAAANCDLSNLFASTEVATIFLDCELRITRFTPAAADLFRLIESDAGRPISDFAPRFHGQDLIADVREVLRTLTPIEKQVRANDGRWFILRVLPYRTIEKVIAGIVVTFVDVTELKRVEETLRESEERFRLMLEGVRDYAICMLEPDGRVATWNSGAERLTGYCAEETVGKPFSRFYSPEDVAAGGRAKNLEAAARQGKIEDEGWRIRKDGTRFWANVVITAIRDQSGSLRGFAEVTRDFTERKHMLEQVQRHSELLKLAQDAILVWRFGSGIELWSRGAEKLYGFTSEQARGRVSCELLQTRFPCPRSEFEELFMRQRQWEGELLRTANDGREVAVWARLQVVSGDDGVDWVFESNRDITERKRAEEALRLSEKRFRTMANAMSQLAWIADGDGYVHWYNERWYQYTGTTPQQMQGWGWQSVHDPDALPKVLERWKASIASGQPFDMVLPLRGADGQFRPFLTRVLPLWDTTGRVQQWFGTGTDISEMEEVREALRKSEERFRMVTDNMSEAVLLFDPEGNLTYQNPASRRLLGLEGDARERIAGEELKASWRAWEGDGRPLVPEQWPMYRVVRGERVDNLVLHVRRVDDGAELDCCYNGRQVYDSSGKVALGFITIRNITEELQAIRALRESEERMRMAQIAGRIGTFERDFRTGVHTWSPELEAMHGLPPGGFAQSQLAWESLVHPEDRAAAIKRFEETVESGQPTEAEWRVVWADGSVHWLSGRWQSFKDADGKPSRLFGVNFDITERKKAEAALRQATERERFLADIIENANAAFAIAAPDGRIPLFNRAFAELVGYSREEIDKSGLTWSADLTPPEWREKEAEALAWAVARHETVRYEKEYLRKDGSRVPIELFVQPVFAEDGSVTHYWAFLTDVTERKAAIEALRASEERLRMAQKAARIGTFEWDLRASRTAWSPELEELHGLPHGGYGGSYQQWASLVHPDDLPEVERCLRESLEVGRLETEYRIVWQDGTVHWVSAHGQVFRDAEGRPTRMFGVNLDITDRKAADVNLSQALAKAEAGDRMLAALMEHVPEGITIVDSAGKVTMVSRRGRDMLDAAEAVGRPLDEIISRWTSYLPNGETSMSARDIPLVRALRQGEAVHDIEMAARTAWGQKVPLLCSAAPIRDAGGQLVGAVVTWRDISVLKQAAEAIERSRRGLSKLATASASVMAKTDLRDMLQAISEAALALTGARLATCGHGFVSGQYIVGGAARAPGAPACSPGDMFRVDRGGVHMALLEDAESIRLTDAELRAQADWRGLPEGHVPMRGLLGVRMVARNGKANGMILVTDKEHGDFTAEDEALLLQLGTVASLALQHVEARMALEAADRRKNEFLAMLSHELRNPLAPMRNSVYILERAAPGGEQGRRAQAIIDRQVAHMTRLVDDLLDVTRISRGKIQLRREPMDFADVVRRAVEDSRSAFRANGLKLEDSIADGPIEVDADRTRIAQVIGNLLNNAAKFTEEGGTITVEVEANAVLGQAIARVRDTGAGIEAEMQPRIFEPFMQAETTLDRSKGGLGLGLALVKGIVEMHGGRVAVHSEGRGTGSEFTICLPLTTKHARVSATVQAPSQAPHRRILVIEDNVDSATSLREVLELSGHEVQLAYTGSEGIAKARAMMPDLILCDIGLPGMDGYEVARSVRHEPTLRSTKLVALSGYAAPEDIAKSRDVGFDDHLAKPVGLDKLAETVLP